MNIAIIGYGRMGKIIEQIAKEKEHHIAYIIDAENRSDLEKMNAQDVDCAIEFTHPESALQNYKSLLEKNIPVVAGTTGWHDKKDQVSAWVKQYNGCLFHSSNFSIGVNIFFQLNKMLASLMDDYPDYEISIEETHHTKKKDAPSGTAISIADQIIDKVDRVNNWSLEANQGEDTIEIDAKRIVDIYGTHAINYDSGIDNIRITHNAKSRLGFAIGALSAATWLQGKKGVYTMEDMLSLKSI
jgi:4-hydroxy-tetrahydrodipicolinate reductase